MAIVSDYAEFDGIGLAAAIAAGEIESADVLDTVEFLIERLNPSLNAIVRPTLDSARRDLACGLPNGPLRGVPMVLKDEYVSVAGVPNDHASALAAGFVREYDTELVKDYRRAGVQFVGKANLPELGASVTTHSRQYGPSSTPWHLDYNSGGSSGGSAAAVAAGIVPIAYGNDGAGSLRIPASCCGLFALKPTRARVSTSPDGGEYWNGLVIEHVLTRSVRDSALLLDLSDSPKSGDYYRAPVKPGPWADAVDVAPPQLRIGFATESPFPAPVHENCRTAAEEAVSLCRDLGHTVEPAMPDFDGPAIANGIKDLVCAHLAAGIDDMAAMLERRPTLENIERATWVLAERGRRLPATRLLEVLELFTATARRAAPFFEQFDLWLTPTLAQPPLPHGTIYTDDPNADRYLNGMIDYIPFTPLANITGNPAINVPLHWTGDGLPVGVQFVAPFGREDLLFSLGAQLEKATLWRNRHPPVSAWNLV